MDKLRMLFSGAVLLPVCLSAGEPTDSIASEWERKLELKEVVIVAKRPVMKQEPDRIVYMTKNDPYAVGLNGIEVLDKIPRVSVSGDVVSVAGKSSVRYIIDGQLLEMPDEAIVLKLKNLQSSGIEKIELLTTPPSKYGATNAAFISITTRNESLGSRGSLWGTGIIREDFNYLAGGNISHTTRKVELSADVSYSDFRGRNDMNRRYSFADYERTSDRITRFKIKTTGVNGLFKYKFTPRMSAGAIVNYSMVGNCVTLNDLTVDKDMEGRSVISVPDEPENSLTLTGFADYMLDSAGKMMSLTYNYFTRKTESYSDVVTDFSSGITEKLTKDADNDYRINSVKLDAALPFSSFRIDAGGAFTAIDNATDLQVRNLVDGSMIDLLGQSNHFNYEEKTTAVYVSAQRNFSSSFFGKIGLRYEYTDVRGIQQADNSNHTRSYGFLCPTLNLSWNSAGAGRFSLSYSTGITRPQFGDLNPFRYYTTVSDYFTGNPDLEASTSHNAEVNYSFKGVYAVLYTSFNRNAVGYITRFGDNGVQCTLPENCLDTNKSGLYASYNRSLTDWWNLNVGGEVFRTCSKSKADDFKNAEERAWSGKLEMNTSWMLNRAKTLILNVRLAHFFPYSDRMARYSSRTTVDCDLRYMLLGGRLNLSLSVSDPFGWSITRSTSYYRDYTAKSSFNIHSHAVRVKIAWSFGRNKVNGVYRDSKERESGRAH